MNKLIEDINEIKATVEADTYGVDANIPLATPELVPPIKVNILRRTLESETETSVVDDHNNLHIAFSKLTLSEVYEVQHAVTSEIQLRENVVAYQAAKQQRKMNIRGNFNLKWAFQK